MLPLRHRPLWAVLSALLVGVVVYGSLQPVPSLPVPGGFDKVEHLSTYFALALWFTGLYPRTAYWKVAAGLLALGLSMEVLQEVMKAGRSGEALDMLANTVGVAGGVLSAMALTGGWARRVDSWLSRD